MYCLESPTFGCEVFFVDVWTVDVMETASVVGGVTGDGRTGGVVPTHTKNANI